MKKHRYIKTFLAGLLLCISGAVMAENPRVTISTNHGDIEVELMAKLAPKTVENFLSLVDDGFYDGLIFHRVIANFMIQGGGYKADLTYKPAPQTVPNESYNGVKNTRGTLAMARLPDPDSADSQFFINVKDNAFLDASSDGAGYTVFGSVVDGMDVVTEIELVNTHLKRSFAALPEETVVIESITRIDLGP